MTEKVVPARPPASPEPLDTIQDILQRFLIDTEGSAEPPVVKQYARAIESACRYHYNRRPREGA